MREPTPHHVVISPYDPEWPLRATLEAARLAGALGGNLLGTEHVGSTSVPGLAAKPVIDLMPIVASLEDLDWQGAAVEALGYEWFGEFGIAGRRFCTMTRDGERVGHLHFFQQGSGEIARHTVFRDYLRAHPEAARAYEAEKRRAAAIHPDDSIAYNWEKSDWIAAELAKAMAWGGVKDTRHA